jgi:hypothetical protein
MSIGDSLMTKEISLQGSFLYWRKGHQASNWRRHQPRLSVAVEGSPAYVANPQRQESSNFFLRLFLLCALKKGRSRGTGNQARRKAGRSPVLTPSLRAACPAQTHQAYQMLRPTAQRCTRTYVRKHCSKVNMMQDRRQVA